MHENSSKKLSIILLKSSDSSIQSEATNDVNKSKDDRYIDLIRKDEILLNTKRIEMLIKINLLDFEFTNIESLSDKLVHIFFKQFDNENIELDYKSIILTSSQTLQAFDLASFCSNDLRDNFADVKKSTAALNSKEQRTLVVYCVGESTANTFRKYLNKLSTHGLDIDSRIDIRLSTTSSTSPSSSEKKQQKQNAIELSKRIISDFVKSSPNRLSHTYSFFPCSSIRKEDLPRLLYEASVPLEELPVYNTIQSKQGIENLKEAVQRALSTTDKAVDSNTMLCLAFFSPSGVETALDIIQSIKSNETVRFVSVGPSTSTKLKEILTAEYHSMIIEMTEPSPQAFLDIIRNF